MKQPTAIKPTRRRRATAAADPVPLHGRLKIPAHIRKQAETFYATAKEGEFSSFGKDGSYFLRVPHDLPVDAAVLRPDLVFGTNLFRFVALTHRESPQTVLAWMIQPKFPTASTRHGKAFIMSVRKFSTPSQLWKPLLAASGPKVTQTESQALLTNMAKSHPMPTPTSTGALRGLLVLEVNDLSGLILTDTVPDFSI